MTDKLRVFVSSVQKELEDERLIVQNLTNTDPFLSAHCTAVLYEFEPASPEKATVDCLATLGTCQVLLQMIAVEYGTPVDGLSITHREYRRAREVGLPVLVFIKGERSMKREEGMAALIKEIEADGLKYKRFANVIELQKEVRAALVKLLRERFGAAPTSDEDETARQTIEATSAFESRRVDRIGWQDLNHALARRLVAGGEGREPAALSDEDVLAGTLARGLVWCDLGSGEYYATAAGIVLLADDPSLAFPQCRILADAYRATERDGDPRDHEDIRAPAPLAIERALAFIDRNTRHPMRIVGLNRVRLDEYPPAALREALVNAAAHRQYEDAGRKVLLEVFADRVIVASPGLPPLPLTLASLRKGSYRPCSRNPVIAKSLSAFHRIEERGSGFRRMRDEMLDHGLDRPTIGTNTGYFEVTFPGPGGDMERIRSPQAPVLVTLAIEAQLNDRQRHIVARVLAEGSVTSGWCLKEFGVVYNTAYRDLSGLVKLGILRQEGRGRSTRYLLEVLPP